MWLLHTLLTTVHEQALQCVLLREPCQEVAEGTELTEYEGRPFRCGLSLLHVSQHLEGPAASDGDLPFRMGRMIGNEMGLTPMGTESVKGEMVRFWILIGLEIKFFSIM